MDEYLGIDVGGTNIKFGIVNKTGELLKKKKHSTKELQLENNFISEFIDLIGQKLSENPQINSVGIAVPGMISKDRLSTVFMANIPEFNNTPLIPLLKEKHPNTFFYLENDANAAAIGEYYFATTKTPDDFIFMTLGTGLGSAAIIDGKIFSGGNGNAMEAGHILATNGKTAEDNMGKKALVKMALKEIKKGKKTILKAKNLNAKDVVNAALENDSVAVDIFNKVGTVLGETLVSTIRILDINTVYIGGGVSKTFDIVKKNMNKALTKHLDDYYLKNMHIELANLGNDAGIIGAAALCFNKE